MFARRDAAQTKPFQVQLWRNNKKLTLGYFATAEAAALCYARSPEAKKTSDVTVTTPLTADEAIATAEAEGLTLIPSDNQAGYKGVNITTWGDSFNDGLAFCALLHKHDENVLNYDKNSDPKKALGNLDTAFTAAEKRWDVPRLLEPEELAAGAVCNRARRRRTPRRATTARLRQ